MGKFIISRRINGEYQFRLLADNNQIILMSEGYTSRISCTNGIKSVQKNAASDENFIRKISSNGKYYFNLKAKNGEIIGTSELYESMAGRENAISSVKRNSLTTVIEGLS